MTAPAISIPTREARGALRDLRQAGRHDDFLEWVTRWHPAVVLAWADAFISEAREEGGDAVS